jgi:hypothetical protein
MAEPTRDDVDALVGPATPHFAYQLRARVRELIEDLSPDHPVRKYGECIGVATADIAAGSHVHVHNMESRRGRKTT